MSAAMKQADHGGRAEYIARLVAAAPPLSAAQCDRLAVLLRPATSQGAAAR